MMFVGLVFPYLLAFRACLLADKVNEKQVGTVDCDAAHNCIMYIVHTNPFYGPVNDEWFVHSSRALNQ